MNLVCLRYLPNRSMDIYGIVVIIMYRSSDHLPYHGLHVKFHDLLKRISKSSSAARVPEDLIALLVERNGRSP